MSPAHRGARAPRSGLGRPGRVLVLLFVALVFLGIVAIGGVFAASHLHHHSSSSNQDYAGPGTGSVVVRVSPGDTATDIARTLVTDGVVASVTAFTDAAEVNTRSAGIQPGYYQLRDRMSATAALNLLLTPSALVEARFTIPEGTSIKNVPTIIGAHTSVTAAQIRAAIAAPAGLQLPTYAQGHVEGFLFPATYDVPPGATAAQVLQMMTARFVQAASDTNLVAGAHALGLTPLQVVIIASIIQRESASPADGAKVARVFYNRLKANMPLGSEFTVAYSGNDAASPYNTYTHTGIPPGPYDSPGQEALTAALTPAAGPYLYFVTLPKEGTQFVNTDAEFETLSTRCRAEGGCKN